MSLRAPAAMHAGAVLLLLVVTGCSGGVTAGAAGSEPRTLTTVALPVKDNAIRVVVAGDTGLPSVHLFAAIMKIHRESPVQAILLVGDNFYPCGVKSPTDKRWAYFQDDIGRLGIPVFPVLGNHDYGAPHHGGRVPRLGCSGADPEAQIGAESANWHFPARSYTLTSELADVVMIDTSPIAYGWTRGQLGSDTDSSILNTLDLALARSKARWKIVVGHHVLFSSGMHGARSSAEVSNMRKLQPVLQKRGVDLVAGGHDHHLELIGSPQTRPLYLISGAGAKTRPYQKRHAGEPPTIFPPPGTDSFLGFALVDIAPSEMEISFYDQMGKLSSTPVLVSKNSSP